MPRGGLFNPDAEYLKHATGFERKQLLHMQAIIEAKSAELRDLREQRAILANRVVKRGLARERRSILGRFER